MPNREGAMSEAPRFTKLELRTLRAPLDVEIENLKVRLIEYRAPGFRFPNASVPVETRIVWAEKRLAVLSRILAKIDALLAVPR